MRAGYFLENVAYRVDVGTIGHTDLQANAAVRIPKHPVRHSSGHQFRVRHQHVLVIERLDLGCSNADLPDEAFDVADRNEVAGPNRSFEQQNESGHKVVGDLLQAETDTQSECAGNDREAAEIDTGLRQPDQEGDDEGNIAEQGDQRLAGATFHDDMLQPASIDPALDPANEDQQRSENDDAADDLRGNELDGAHGTAANQQLDQPVQRSAGLVPDIDQVEDHTDPEDQVRDHLHEANAASRHGRLRAERAARRRRIRAFVPKTAEYGRHQPYKHPEREQRQHRTGYAVYNVSGEVLVAEEHRENPGDQPRGDCNAEQPEALPQARNAAEICDQIQEGRGDQQDHQRSAAGARLDQPNRRPVGAEYDETGHQRKDDQPQADSQGGDVIGDKASNARRW